MEVTVNYIEDTWTFAAAEAKHREIAFSFISIYSQMVSVGNTQLI